MTDYPNNIPAKLEIIKASEITPKEVRWLWYPYIPFGKVTLLQGDPGDGKSKLMLSLAALLSKGAPLPFADEDESGEPMTVIHQTTEDMQTILLYRDLIRRAATATDSSSSMRAKRA